MASIPTTVSPHAPVTATAIVTALILAAGKGTRMKSDLAKVLHHLAGRPLLMHVLDTCVELKVAQKIVVVGHQRDQVEQIAAPWLPAIAVQDRQLGTGHAVMVAEPLVTGDLVVVLCGDCPMTPASLLANLIAKHLASGAACTGVACRMADPTGYGRMLTDAQGNLQRIVEHKDADEATRQIDLINSGIYVFDRRELFRCLKAVRPDNAQGEYYLTDVVGMLAKEGKTVGLVVTDDLASVLGVNTPADLAKAEELLIARKAGAALSSVEAVPAAMHGALTGQTAGVVGSPP